jgi:hypothetical protein
LLSFISFICVYLEALGRSELRGHDMEEWVGDVEGERGRGGGGQEDSDLSLRIVHGGMELCSATEAAISPTPGQGRTRSTATDTETKMQHFDVGNRHQIKDAPPNTWATVHCRDVVTMSELARRGFHLVDMSGEVWTMHREG